MPEDIKLVGPYRSENQNFLAHHHNQLTVSYLNVLLKKDNAKKLKLLGKINLLNCKNHKNELSHLDSINIRIDKIFKAEKNLKVLPNKSPLIMGIVNVTSDSFYDGGKYNSTDKALKHAYQLLEEGADIIDVGAESTRPGSVPVNSDNEKKKLLPVIRNLIKNDVLVSCDTRNSSTILAVLNEGVKIINDISGLNYDKKTLITLKEFDCLYVLVHSQGLPGTMQINPFYNHAPTEIYQFFKKKLDYLKKEGLDLSRIIIDPGIGFGKNDRHNFSILKFLPIFLDLGAPILVGLSRKSFIGRFLNNENADRLSCSLVLGLDSYLKGASILRVHDVKETRNVIEVYKKANFKKNE